MPIRTPRGKEIRSTLSFGMTCPGAGRPLSGAFGRADRALYRSKTEGRNRVSVE